MLNSQTIKNKLIGLTLVGLLVTGLVGAFSYKSILNLNTSMNKIVVSSAILRNHMYGDMLHDALNSDVNAALLATENVGGIDIKVVENELKEHSELFTDTLNKNDKLITDLKTRAALNKVLPALQNYITSASNIVHTAKNDRLAAIRLMDDFHRAFTVLEVEMEELTVLIEENVALTHKNASAEKATTTAILLIVSTLGAVAMIFISVLVIKNITVPLEALVHVSDRVASGDLTVRIDVLRVDEIGKLSRAMEKMRVNLLSVITQISSTTGKLSESVNDILNVTHNVSSNMGEQRSETEQVATAMNEMTATVHEVSNNILAAANSAQQAAVETDMGSKIVEETVQSIKLLANQISDASEIINRVENNTHNISSVLDVIRNIAEQTNLLALNAAIEAARAGEQGRGFAVVADEVRTLASRTQESTGEINQMITQLQQGSKLSVDAMNKSCEQAGLVVNKAENAGKSLMAIASTVQKISGLSEQIAISAEEQTAVSEEINRNIVHINEAAVHTSDGTQKTANAANHLAQITVELKQLVNQFRL